MCLGSAMAAAQAADDPGVASNLIALERVGKMQAWQNKDVTALGAVLDDAFVYVDPEGVVLTKAEVLRQIKTTGFAPIHGRSHHCEAARKDCDRHRPLPDEGHGTWKAVRPARSFRGYVARQEWAMDRVIMSSPTPGGN